MMDEPTKIYIEGTWQAIAEVIEFIRPRIGRGKGQGILVIDTLPVLKGDIE